MAKKSKTKAKTKKKAVKAKVKKAAPKRKAAKKAVRKLGSTSRRPELPQGYSSVTAYLVAENASAIIAYYKAVFGAKEEMRFASPGGKIGHAELRIGDTKIMIADEHPDHHAFGPRHYNGSPVSLTLYVKDVDATVALAVKQGAKLLREVTDQFYGDRSGTLTDPFGHTWTIATHKEDVSPAELKKRMAQQKH